MPESAVLRRSMAWMGFIADIWHCWAISDSTPAKRRNDAAELLLQVADTVSAAAELHLDIALHSAFARIAAEQLRGIDVDRLAARDAAAPGRALADDDARDGIDRPMARDQMGPA